MHELSPFKEDGFNRGFVIMPGLQLGVQFKSGQWFRYDGLVPSLEGYIQQLPEAIREHLIGYDYNEKGGFNLKLSTEKEEGFLMAVLDISPRANVFNQAHESSEVLRRAGKLSKLQIFIQSNGFKVDLAKLSQHEVGTVCGLAATLRAGYSRDEMIRLFNSNEDYDTVRLLEQLNL